MCSSGQSSCLHLTAPPWSTPHSLSLKWVLPLLDPLFSSWQPKKLFKIKMISCQASVSSFPRASHCTQDKMQHPSLGPTRCSKTWALPISVISSLHKCPSHTSFPALHWTFEACFHLRTDGLAISPKQNGLSQVVALEAFSCHFDSSSKSPPQTFLTTPCKVAFAL